ncbi:MAG: D-glycero-beta-D-manno-heptose 1-phosphate adenylyltransferase [Bacteroidales bacterium]|jgi:rfaE bifunctional protein nucleotidyltransferase chain/domain|nr:D-glycero-beta-D-manno-heptose 1-phosphate adenylyltransferase [Bacteroidales bacterium]
MNLLLEIKNKIVCDSKINDLVFNWKQNSEKIVFTNGCFDILHLGHISYLAQARNLGDKLIIGLNSDVSVKRLKGENRPINDEFARAMILASLVFVDTIIFFEEDTPELLIKKITPNILVKGGDYKVENIAGATHVMKNGGKVEIIPFVAGYSTTKIIEQSNSI